MLKKLFGKKGKKEGDGVERELTIDDLITLERYDEALQQLQVRVKQYPKDLHAHLRIAEVYVALKNVTKALDEYGFVADSYADDGFYEKAIALLGKAARLAPGDDMIPRRIERYRRAKLLEHRRSLAIEGLKRNPSTEAGSQGNSAVQIQLLWNKIARSHLVERLDGEQLKRLFSVVEMVKTKGGAVLAEPQVKKPAIFLVVDGVVDAQAEINGKPMNIRSFTSGDLIGDSVLLEHKPWPAKYVIAQPGTLFRLTRKALERAMDGESDPVAFLSVLRQQQNDREVSAMLSKLGGGIG